MSLVVLGMVSGVRVTTNGIEVDLVMNCPGCPGVTAALEGATRSLSALSGGSRVQLRLLPQTWKPPWN
jgi:metal-sulfur cluster biosynthetic enzyme